ncbi:MAG: hypothetical protein ACI94D_000241, partial [Neolewinella sp.]
RDKGLEISDLAAARDRFSISLRSCCTSFALPIRDK